ncbi:hypothetical protein BH23PAT2_BH23PAT2_06100 [soil metagenome]
MPKHSKTSVLCSLLLTVLLPAQGIVFAVVPEDQPVVDPSSLVLISELQTGSSDGATSEFIELYNSSDYPVDIANWDVQYKSATGSSWTSKISSDQADSARFIIEPRGYFLLATETFLGENVDISANAQMNSGLAAGGGHVRLVFKSDLTALNETIIDLVEWGNADTAEGDMPAPAPDKDQSLKRIVDEDGWLVDTDNSSADFLISDNPSPQATFPVGSDSDESTGNEQDADDNESNPEIEDGPGEDQTPQADQEDEESDDSMHVVAPCSGVFISEILPNPTGVDTNNEFIELYNPTNKTIELNGCKIELKDGPDKDFTAFDEIALEPNEYRAFYDSDTNIRLPNGSGGTVFLLFEDEELHEVTYPGDMSDDVSWSWLGNDDWSSTYTLTPDQKNVLQETKPCPAGQDRNEETNRCRHVESAEVQLVPCMESQERNPETNRCRNVNPVSSALTPCGPGKQRNPATNRCRSISNTSTLVPCREGQERNPETNRCRSVGSATSNLVPCREGQERNPETNRCRKVTTAGTADVLAVQDIRVAPSTDDGSWILAGTMVVLAFLYGAWEWRREIIRLFSRVRLRFTPSS